MVRRILDKMFKYEKKLQQEVLEATSFGIKEVTHQLATRFSNGREVRTIDITDNGYVTLGSNSKNKIISATSISYTGGTIPNVSYRKAKNSLIFRDSKNTFELYVVPVATVLTHLISGIGCT